MNINLPSDMDWLLSKLQYERGLQEFMATPHVFCHCQDIQNRYNLYAALMLYQ